MHTLKFRSFVKLELRSSVFTYHPAEREKYICVGCVGSVCLIYQTCAASNQRHNVAITDIKSCKVSSLNDNFRLIRIVYGVARFWMVE